MHAEADAVPATESPEGHLDILFDVVPAIESLEDYLDILSFEEQEGEPPENFQSLDPPNPSAELVEVIDDEDPHSAVQPPEELLEGHHHVALLHAI